MHNRHPGSTQASIGFPVRTALAKGDCIRIAKKRPIKLIYTNSGSMIPADMLEKKYANIRQKAIAGFVLIALVGVITAGLWYVIAHRIMRHVERLTEAIRQVSIGNMTPDIGPIANSKIGIHQKSFLDMLRLLEERESRRRVARVRTAF